MSGQKRRHLHLNDILKASEMSSESSKKCLLTCICRIAEELFDDGTRGQHSRSGQACRRGQIAWVTTVCNYWDEMQRQPYIPTTTAKHGTSIRLLVRWSGGAC